MEKSSTTLEKKNSMVMRASGGGLVSSALLVLVPGESRALLLQETPARCVAASSVIVDWVLKCMSIAPGCGWTL